MKENQKWLENLEKIGALVEHYQKNLDRYTIEQLCYKSKDDEWSLGQMYNHLIRSTLFMQLGAIAKCAEEESTETAEGMSEHGQRIFQMGAFPPIKIKVPDSPQHTPPQPESKEQLAKGLNEVWEKTQSWATKLHEIPGTRKVMHPRLGYLNAPEWFQLTEMHLRHHLRQQETLEQEL
ncbi:DinB family protein [Paenibacillus apiarius]|uniref:DinB family protein n=1 Tax=Paenibacillus apiarius TaxID=46240 RepID=UPI00197D2436|nr:DinB family protein [Paenibacillus apiarius]MBN3522885.1 DinB family protein [Paenibacillus apiarius]